MKRYKARAPHVLTREGARLFPRLKDKVFEVRVYLLNREYCQARVKGKRTWSRYWTGFFRKVAR